MKQSDIVSVPGAVLLLCRLEQAFVRSLWNPTWIVWRFYNILTGFCEVTVEPYVDCVEILQHINRLL